MLDVTIDGDEKKVVGAEEHPTEVLVRKSNPGQLELQPHCREWWYAIHKWLTVWGEKSSGKNGWQEKYHNLSIYVLRACFIQ